MDMTETIYAGKLVLSGGGRFVHRAKDETRTVCGKRISKLLKFQDSEPDCYVCQRRSDRRR